MKTVFSAALTTALLALALPAHADFSTLNCQTVANGNSYDMNLEISARRISVQETRDLKLVGTLRDVVVTAKQSDYSGSMKTEIGRRDLIDSDEKYSPRKYKDTVRFDLSTLTDTATFGTFTPGDMCSIKLMIPTNATKKIYFNASAIINCDQSGGSQTLACVATLNEQIK